MRQRVRALLATPRFTIVSLLTLTLLVGGITTIFSVVNGVLLRALPYPDAQRLVRIETLDARGTFRAPSRAQVERFKEASQSFDRWAGYRIGYVASMVDLAGEPKQVQDVLVTSNALSALGFQAARGRLLNASEHEPVVVINYSFWQNLLGGREDAIGSSVLLRKSPVTIVGVVRDSDGPPLAWLALPTIYRPVEQGDDTDPPLTTVARLSGTTTIAQARAELETIAAASAVAPDTNRPRLTPLLDAIVGETAQLVWLFFGVAALVLLIGIGNLTSLQLARNSERRREVMVRFALGASRPRLIRELVGEAAIVGVVGGIAGLLVAAPTVRLVVGNLPARFPRADEIGIDLNVALFAIAIALGATLVIGLIGAWTVTAADTTSQLTDAAIKGASRPVLQGTLIGAQTAVALMLLVGTGLLLGSLTRLIARDSGMREDGLWMATGSLPGRYQGDAAQLAFWNAALADVKQLPSVQEAALMVNMSGPFSGGDIREGGIVAEGSSVDPRSVPSISLRRVSAGYFETLGMPIKRGRAFVSSDDAGAERVAVINELAASQLWPGQDAVGKRFISRKEPVTVIGVIADYRHTRLDADPAPQIYLAHDQRAGIASTATIMFRAASRQAVADVQAMLSGKEKDMRVRTASIADARWRLVALERFRIAVLSAFALTAVALAIVGIAGLVGYTVAQRGREVAIRIALGAAQLHILRVTTVQTLLPAALGVIAGIGGAIAATRLIRAYLVDITPLDAQTYATAIAAMTVAIAAASLMPARRATRIDPAVTLRRD